MSYPSQGQEYMPPLMHLLCLSPKNEARERSIYLKAGWAWFCKVTYPEDPAMDINCWILDCVGKSTLEMNLSP